MEIWKDIKNYEGLYQISNLGNVKSLVKWDVNKNDFIKSDNILTPNDNGKGYLIIGLRKNRVRKMFYIHRLVAIHFLENPDCKNFINHKDFNKHNNNIDNLEWVTQKENVNYSVDNMKHKKSVTHSNTNEKYISYRASNGRYRVVIDKKEYGTFKTLEDAIKKRDSILKEVI